jgi:GAF domain-containing protein
MRHPYYLSNGEEPPSTCICSARQGETGRPTPVEIRTQRERVPQFDYHDGCSNLAAELMTIITAQRAISGEIEVSRLVETMLVVAVEHVSAERGLLFLVRGRTHEIEAETTTYGGGIRVVFPPASATSVGFPESVLRYVIRTEEGVVLDDAAAKNQFSDDDYMRSRRVRSIVCFPLITQRELVGVLYLENNLAPRAFAPDRLAGAARPADCGLAKKCPTVRRPAA